MSPARPDRRLLREGETCGWLGRAKRVAFLIDGEEFFAAVAAALESARRSVWMLGWDFHSSVRLRRGDDGDDELVPLLESCVRRHPELRVHVLAWDFAMLYALEREVLPVLQFGARTHRNIRFATDSAHPPAASHHQKVVVVDDALAFVGGFDLTAHRWDTREHRPDDPRRTTPSGRPYAPFHDVQIAVDGEAAGVLGELARERWERATGKSVERVDAAPDVWPAGLAVDVADVEVGISRTLAAHAGAPEIREVEALYRESIAAARHSIYIENQYLTSPRITEWLCAQLREPDGPEVLIIGPRENAGWLEESTMGALRDRAIRELRAADPGERLRILYPHIEGLTGDQLLNVHSKLMVIDGEFARIGSSNLSNRSLGFDSECDVSIEARSRPEVREAIEALRDGLLAEHLGASRKEVAAEIARRGSLVQAVDALSGRKQRTLRPIEIDASRQAADAIDALGVVDPEHPAPLEELVARFSSEIAPVPRSRRQWTVVATVAVLAGGLLAWQFTPLSQQLTPERLGALLSGLAEPWYGPLLATAIFALAALCLVPVTALTVASGLALGPGVGIAVAWGGALASAALGYLAGRGLWRDAVRRIAGARLNELSRRLARRGILSSALLQMVPAGPYMVGNLVAGASHVPMRDFLVGTGIGILPGTVLLAVSGDAVRVAIGEPSGAAWRWVAFTVLLLFGAAIAARRLVARTWEPGSPSEGAAAD